MSDIDNEMMYNRQELFYEGKAKKIWPTQDPEALIVDYKDDALGDSPINGYFAQLGIDLMDFKIEFGRYHGQIILADETPPDTCRFWGAKTHEKLDKDRFRRDIDNVEEAYKEVFRRLEI